MSCELTQHFSYSNGRDSTWGVVHVATAWEQLLGSFYSACFHNTAALDNSMSANCRTSCPPYKRPTGYLCGIAQFISTTIASSQLKSNVLSHPEFWISHVENVLWTWHRALHCAYSQRNPEKLVRKGRGYWPAPAGRGTAGEGWQQNNKCWSQPSVRAKQSSVRWSRCRSAILLVHVLVFHSCNRPTIDHGSLEIWSSSEPSLCFFFFLTELQNSITGKAAAAAPSLVRFGWLPESTTHVCSAASLEEDASGNE